MLAYPKRDTTISSYNGDALALCVDRRDFKMDMAMRGILLTIAALVLAGGACAEPKSSADDAVLANAALRELHNLAFASARSERAARDSDRLGCQAASNSIQEAAHEALSDMHQMSFTPLDALNRVSSLLRLINDSPYGCPNDMVTGAGILPLLAGQAIFSLRIDYAIGDADWYSVNAKGTVEAKNPIRYAQSLSDQHYSWVDVRPKGMLMVGVSDWKAELASYRIDDPAIENSGSNLKTVEVGFRKNSGDSNTDVYFFRTKEEAKAAAKVANEQADADAKAAAEAKASTAMWTQKLISLPYMIANRDVGFKLAYGVCKDTGKNAEGQNTCKEEESYDWSDNRAMPYVWFSDLNECENASYKLNMNHPPNVKIGGNDGFTSYCVPAPKVSGRVAKGYKGTFTLTPPEADSSENVYADLRAGGAKAANIYRTFATCYDAMDAAYDKAAKDLSTDEKNVNFLGNCVRVY